MCLDPRKIWKVGYKPNGKQDVRLTGRWVQYLYGNGSGQWYKHNYSDASDPLAKLSDAEFDELTRYTGAVINRDFLLVPCGQCIECRLNYSRNWATRMCLEKEYHDRWCFVTLTYDNDHLDTIQRYHAADPDTGEGCIPVLSLNYDDLKQFMKNLRRALEYRGRGHIRFYAGGEYGELHHRPHFHLIIFGLEVDDLEFLRKSKLGHHCYVSNFLQKIWKKGQVIVNEASWDSCAYTARYVMKKKYGQASEFYERFNIEPEKSRMSIKPGIARQYFNEHKEDIYRFDELYLKCSGGGRTVRPPSYYDHLYGLEEPDAMEYVKSHRLLLVEEQEAFVRANTTLSYEERLAVKHDLYEKRALMLKRSNDDE